MFEKIADYFSKENRMKRKEQNKREQLAFYNRVMNESFKIMSADELGDIYYSYPGGTICYLNDKNVFIKKADDTFKWERYKVYQSAQMVFPNPWTKYSGRHVHTYTTKDFYPNHKIRKQLKEELESGVELTEMEKKAVTEPANKGIGSLIGTAILFLIYMLYMFLN